MAVVTMKQLLEAGVHFGHQTRRWNPKMAPYIYGERNGIHIVDLRQTLDQLEHAYAFIRDIVADGGIVLFVGTKTQAAEAVATQAERASMPYVNFRWYGGMLTNFATIHKRIFYMKELETMESSGTMEALPKKERLRLRRELAKLQRDLTGVASMTRVPDAVFIVDLNTERIAAREAIRLDIPIIALADTNVDPDDITVVIPGNDDAIRAAQVVATAIADACVEGRRIAGADLDEFEARDEEFETVEDLAERSAEAGQAGEPAEKSQEPKAEEAESPAPAQETEGAAPAPEAESAADEVAQP
ncbi:MAG: 30S ribosomal protein S2 [Acidimicrobiia bacterium]